MLIIPVLDLRHGRIVHARRGDRSTYRPVRSPLSPSNEPADVLAAFLHLYPFRVFYLADLDAIIDRKPQAAVVEAMLGSFEGVEFWVDAGISTAGDWKDWQRLKAVRPVIGSESLESLPAAYAVLDALSEAGPVLSLDFARRGLLGPPELASDAGIWPQRMIVMSLDRVGSHEGPDTPRLIRAREHAPGRDYYAAGGIRHTADLEALDAAGATGALVASALHDRSITRAELERFDSLAG